MFKAARHFVPMTTTWDANEAHAAIQEIVADALAALDSERLWPPRLMNDCIQHDSGSVYFDGAGVT